MSERDLHHAPSAVVRMVNMNARTIDRSIFVDPAIYALEQEHVFARSWLFVGHTSQIPAKGDFFLSRMGEDSVILNRDMDGKIHVFLNSCRHRGMRLCRYDFGNSKHFVCPYHGWGYRANGQLAGVPEMEKGYENRLDTSAWSLIEVPQIIDYRGTVWACWDAQGPDFRTAMGVAIAYLDAFLDLPDGSDGEVEVIAGIHKWRMPCNWKWAAENFAGDIYHNVSHASVDRLRISPSRAKGRHTFDVVKDPAHTLNLSEPALGHAARAVLRQGDYPYTSQYPEHPLVDEYFRSAYEERRRRLGERARLDWMGGNLFPNMSFSNGRTSIAVWHPKGPHETEAWRWYLLPKSAPQEVKDVLRAYVMRYAGPGGMTEQDDMENWGYAHQSCRSTIARRYPFNYQLGTGKPFEAPGAHLVAGLGVVSEGISEHNQRGLYGRWAELMDTPATAVPRAPHSCEHEP